MKTTIIKALLPYILLVLVGIGGSAYFFNMKHSIDYLEWQVATLETRAVNAEYNLERELEWREKDLQWKREWNTTLQQLNKDLDSYTKQLREIEDERETNGVSNNLSVPVKRVLKEFNTPTN